MRAVRFLAAVVVVGIFWAMLLYTVVLLVAPFDRLRHRVNRIGRMWTGLWKWFLGVKVQVFGAENAREGGPFLCVSNHVSYLDVLALYDDFPIPLRFLAKKTLVWVPVFGTAFYTLDHVYIDRRDKSRHKDSLAALAKKAREGKSIFIFPSGKRAEDGRLGEWKKGAFVLAAELQIPILPVGIIGSQQLHGIGDWFPRPGRITMNIGRPIATTGATYEDRDRLLQQARQAVEELLDHVPV